MLAHGDDDYEGPEERARHHNFSDDQVLGEERDFDLRRYDEIVAVGIAHRRRRRPRRSGGKRCLPSVSVAFVVGGAVIHNRTEGRSRVDAA